MGVRTAVRTVPTVRVCRQLSVAHICRCGVDCVRIMLYLDLCTVYTVCLCQSGAADSALPYSAVAVTTAQSLEQSPA